MKNIINHKIILVLVVSFCSLLNAADNHLEFSFVKTDGNTDSTVISGKLKTKKELSSKDSFKAEAYVLYNKTDNKTSANQYRLEFDYNHLLTDRLYTYLGMAFVKDELSEYDYRLNIGPGFGYKVLNNDIHKLDLEGGINYAYDKYSEKSNESYVATETKLNYEYKVSNNTSFKQMLNYLQSLKESKTYFLTSETALQVKMVENLSMALSYRVDYTNDTVKEKTDKKFLTSIIYDF